MEPAHEGQVSIRSLLSRIMMIDSLLLWKCLCCRALFPCGVPATHLVVALLAFWTAYLSNPVSFLLWGADQIQVQPLPPSSPVYIVVGDIREVIDLLSCDDEAMRLSRKSLPRQ